MNALNAGMKNNLTTLFGSIPGAAVALGELWDVLDGDAATVFEPKLFALGVATALAFLLSKDANKTGVLR